MVASTAVCSTTGARLGKGAGYGEVEWGILAEMGIVSDETPVATLVHGAQLVSEDVLPSHCLAAHDLPVDLVATPQQLLRSDRKANTWRKPAGIDWTLITHQMAVDIGALRELRRIKGLPEFDLASLPTPSPPAHTQHARHQAGRLQSASLEQGKQQQQQHAQQLHQHVLRGHGGRAHGRGKGQGRGNGAGGELMVVAGARAGQLPPRGRGHRHGQGQHTRHGQQQHAESHLQQNTPPQTPGTPSTAAAEGGGGVTDGYKLEGSVQRAPRRERGRTAGQAGRGAGADRGNAHLESANPNLTYT